MQRGNSAIQLHAENGRDLLLFAKNSQGRRYMGQYVYDGHHMETAPDTLGNLRNAIVFNLRPLEAVIIESEQEQPRTTALSLSDLRARALDAAQSQPKQSERLAASYQRAAAVRNYVFARALGECEYCSQPAPFKTARGRPFLEAHHIRRMSDGGPDDPRYMIGVCPNCHRPAHYGADAAETNKKMQAVVSQREADGIQVARHSYPLLAPSDRRQPA